MSHDASRPVPLSRDASARESGTEDLSGAALDRFLRIFERAIGTAIITIDAEGVVTGWSEGARQILGWTEAEMLGRSLGCIFPEEEGGEQALRKEIAQAIATGTGGGEGWRLRKSGVRFWAIGETRPLSDTGTRAGFVKILRDRTEHREAVAKLVELACALVILYRTGASLARETDLHVLVQTVTDAGVALTGAQFGAFIYNVTDPAGESYMLYSLSGVPREAFSKFPMPRNTAIFGPTFAGEGIVRSDDITRDPRYGKNAPYHGMPAGHLPVRSYLAVPVVSRSGAVIGGLFFGHSEVGVFDERSARSLSGLAGAAAVA